MQYKRCFQREPEGLRTMLRSMSELLLISHNTLPKNRSLMRTGGNVWGLALHDDRSWMFLLSQNKRRISLSATACFEEQLPDYHCWPLLHGASSIRHVLLPVTVLVCLCSFSGDWITHSFWGGDLLYQSCVPGQRESQNSFSQGNNPLLSHFRSLPYIILACFIPS